MSRAHRVSSPAAAVVSPPPLPATPATLEPVTEVVTAEAAPVVAEPPITTPQPAVAPPAQHPSRSVMPEQPAVVDLLSQLINAQRRAGQSFFMVVVPEDAYPSVEGFPSVEALIAAMKIRLKAECSVFPFLGYKLAVTKGPFRFLKTPFGGNIPLFDAPPDELEEEPHGWVGSEPFEPLVPPAPAANTEQIQQEEAPTGDTPVAPATDDTSPFDVGGRSSGE